MPNEKKSINEIIKVVYSALEAKGYNPKSQIIGYILSGDLLTLRIIIMPEVL